MHILNILLILGSVLFLHFIIERAVRRRLQIEKKQGFASYEHVNSFHRLVEFILILLYFGAGTIAANSSHPITSLYTTMILFFISLLSFRVYMEWKIDRKSKQYLLTLSNSVFLISFAILLKWTTLDFFF
ncbi:DUF4181 domain-containing protein [Metabacillus sp. RGM 3146]|uniref:DUF4181 domain-containing protein n=1 Tax=Metabacillus sp. RGM 3146 TaxID=3401092 RepID=UPI003B994EA7